MLAVIAGSATFLGYLFTRNPKFLLFTKTIIKVSLLFAALVAALYVLERVLLV